MYLINIPLESKSDWIKESEERKTQRNNSTEKILVIDLPLESTEKGNNKPSIIFNPATEQTKNMGPINSGRPQKGNLHSRYDIAVVVSDLPNFSSQIMLEQAWRAEV